MRGLLLAAFAGFAIGLILGILLLSSAAALGLLVGLLFVSLVLIVGGKMVWGIGLLTMAAALGVRLVLIGG